MKLSEMNFAAKDQEKKQETAKQFDEKNMTDEINKLKNMSNDDLFVKLSKEIESQKANGTFDSKGLLNSIESVKGYLPQNVYENMKNLIKGL